jgi:hypothetical protein
VQGKRRIRSNNPLPRMRIGRPPAQVCARSLQRLSRPLGAHQTGLLDRQSTGNWFGKRAYFSLNNFAYSTFASFR